MLSKLPDLGAQRRILVFGFSAVAVVALCSVLVILQTRAGIQAQAYRDLAARRRSAPASGRA